MTSPTPQSPRLNSLVQTLAEAYLSRGQFAEAADSFSELLRNGLQTPNVYRNLALALLGLESLTASAQQIYQYVLKNFPNDRELCLNICALLLQHKAQDQFALKCYQQTLALNPPPAREVQWALAKHLQNSGYASAAFEIFKRMALRENGAEAQTLTHLMQVAVRLDKQQEARNLLQYLEGRNERAHGVARVLALDYARTFLRQSETLTLSTREWQTITQAALRHERLESMSAACEFITLRLALARMNSRNAQRYSAPYAETNDTQVADFLQRLSPSAAAPTALKNVYGLRLRNLDQIRAEAGETLARNLAQKFLAFAGKQLAKAAQATCYPLADGFLASADSLEVLAGAAVDLLHKIERYNRTAAQGAQLFAQTVLHAQHAKAPQGEHAGMEILYETLNLLKAENEEAGALMEWGNRLWVPCAVYEQELRPEILPAKNLGLGHLQAEEFPGEVYEAVWRNPLEYVEEKTPYDWGRFLVFSKLRQSRISGTYRGRDRQLERNVIVRALSPHLSAKLAQEEALREHALTAIRNVAKLEAPGIAAIYDMGFHEDIFFYAREYLEGQTLEQVSRRGGGRREFTLAESVKLILRLCRILSVAHRQGVAHGNLKPENVWLFANEELKLTDFYVPGFSERPEPAAFMSFANWRYTAPELFHDLTPNAQSDIYALGVMLYELAGGALPSPPISSLLEWQEYDLPPISELHPDMPAGFSETLARACAKNPNRRFPTLQACENALRLFA